MKCLALAFLFFSVLNEAQEPAQDPTTRAWKLLEDGIGDKTGSTRVQAIHALGLMTNSRRAAGLAERALINDPDKNVRAEAAGALGRMGASSARPKLRQALQDKEIKVIIAAANGLYQLKDPAAYQIYYALLTGEQKSNSGMIHSEMDILHDRKQMEKLAVETGIGFVPFGGISYEAWKTMTRDDVSPVRAAAARGLALDPDPKSGAALAKFCTDKKWQVRAAVVEAIASRNDPSLEDAVEGLLIDDNATVRFDAAAALVRLAAVKQGRALVRKGH